MNLNHYQNYINFRKNKIINGIVVYQKDHYSIKFRRNNDIFILF